MGISVWIPMSVGSIVRGFLHGIPMSAGNIVRGFLYGYRCLLGMHIGRTGISARDAMSETGNGSRTRISAGYLTLENLLCVGFTGFAE